MSNFDVQFSKNRGLTNNLSLSKRRSTEPTLITTPNLLDLQLNLPDPINRPTFSLVRGVKVPSSHPPPSVVYHYPPQPLPKTLHHPKPQLPFHTPLPHRQYTAPELGSRNRLSIANNNTHLQPRAHVYYQPQRSNIVNSVPNMEETKKRHEEKIYRHTKDAMLSESADFPGIPVIYRSDEVKRISPDRLNLESRHLTVMPIFEKEEQLRLLNLQMNMISRIQHLSALRSLIFLDLYDNLISEISGLDSLVSLRVLMLGKNRIRSISGLANLLKLDVLDLHGNLIREIQNLGELLNLRVLNLAGNEITVLGGLENLKYLTELNFRRNKITNVTGLNELPLLQRLFLAHNQISDFEHLIGFIPSSSLRDLTLDNNPIQNNAFYRPTIIRRCPTLIHLDGVTVNEEDRKSVVVAMQKVDEKKEEENRQILMKARRQQTLVSLREKFFSSHPHLTDESSSLEQIENVDTPNQEVADCIYEVVGDCIKLYGKGSLEYLDRTLPNGIKRVVLSYIEFDCFLPYLQRLKTKLPDVRMLEFFYNDINNLNQINALDFIGMEIHELIISPEGNPITSFNFFTDYVVFRLKRLKLRLVNGKSVPEVQEAPYFLLNHPEDNSADYLDYCTDLITDSYPKQLREANRITQQAVGNAVRKRTRDKWFYEVWDEVFSEAVKDNLKEMRDSNKFTDKYLSQ